MTFSEKMKAKARSKKKILVLPEGTEPRTIAASQKIMDEGLASQVFLLGNNEEVLKAAEAAGVTLTDVTILDPASSDRIEAYAAEYTELRKHKGMTVELAREQVLDPLKWGALMVRLDDAHAMVAGAQNSTGNVLLSAFTIIKTKPGTKYASSCFVICSDKKELGVDGQFIFSDCGTIPDPNVEQLAEITIAASDSCRAFLDTEPVTAMLSFSTKGSASHPSIDKVTNALALVKEKAPELNVDGELQLDAAIIGSIGASKAPGSVVAGKANTLIFPDLQAGNIAYKLAQRLAGAEAYGPLLQGFAKPVNDLSRGCSVEDIVVTAAISIAQVAE